MSEIIERLTQSPARWLANRGPEARVVHSTRVRLARNLESMPFPPLVNRAPESIGKLVAEGLRLAASSYLLKSMHVIVFEKDSDGAEKPVALDRSILFERHLISREFLHGGGRMLVLDEHETVSIMVNEEDHFRFQVLRCGLDAMEAWRVLKQIERDADGILSFAFRPPYGYLTSCPTNLGTGLRVSALCHLPGLARLNELPSVVNAASHVGIAVRGFYGEGSRPLGNFFQISNRTTLGQGEEEIVENVESAVRHVVERELKARERVVAENRLALEDAVHRSRAVLSSARILPSGEMMDLLSTVRLGLDLGIVGSPDLATLNTLQIRAQPGHLQKMEKRRLGDAERDVARANYIRGMMKSEA